MYLPSIHIYLPIYPSIINLLHLSALWLSHFLSVWFSLLTELSHDFRFSSITEHRGLKLDLRTSGIGFHLFSMLSRFSLLTLSSSCFHINWVSLAMSTGFWKLSIHFYYESSRPTAATISWQVSWQGDNLNSLSDNGYLFHITKNIKEKCKTHQPARSSSFLPFTEKRI